MRRSTYLYWTIVEKLKNFFSSVLTCLVFIFVFVILATFLIAMAIEAAKTISAIVARLVQYFR